MVDDLYGKTRLVIVAGHAIPRSLDDPLSDDSWILLDFQRGEPPCFVGHIRRGVELAAADPGAMLIFSGGQSRREAGPLSEAQGYCAVAARLDWFGFTAVSPSVATEEFSRDSFENLLFSLCRFRELTGRYPEHVTFVSFAFKRERFDFFREAIRWPRDRFTFDGPNNPERIEHARRAEAHTLALYRADPYSAGPELRAKRESRNPFRNQHGFFTTCPELADLLRWRGPELFPGPLPW
jgi:hypothetical protein